MGVGATFAGSIVPLLDPYLQKLEFQEILKLYNDSDSVYENISMRSLPGQSGLLRRAFEAQDLAQVMPRAGTTRSSPGSIKVSRGEDRATLGPRTSRVAELGAKSSVADIVHFVGYVAADLASGHVRSDFLNTFAEPLSLSQLDPSTTPESIIFHWSDIEERIAESEGLQTINQDGEWKESSEDDIKELRQLLLSEVSVELDASANSATDNEKKYVLKADQTNVGHMTQRAKSFQVSLPRLRRYRLVEDGGQPTIVSSAISREQPLTVTFSDPALAYSERVLFRNRRLPEDAASLLSCFIELPFLDSCVSEKGSFSPSGTAFDPNSVFGVVETYFRSKATGIVCDDLGVEWADHIVLRESPVREILFVHSKWKAGTTSGASCFHELASQGIKNIGNLTAPNANKVLSTSSTLWSKNYKTNKIQTRIHRTRLDPGGIGFAETLIQMSKDLSTVRTMCLVAPFLSKNDFASNVTRMQNNDKVAGHVVQLVWILAAFLDTCRSNGVQPRVYCVA